MFTSSHGSIIAACSVIAISCASVACSGVEPAGRVVVGEKGPEGRVAVALASKSATTSLGVTTWEVYERAGTTIILGLDRDMRIAVSAQLLIPADGEGDHVDLVDGAASGDRVSLLRDGTVVGEPSARFRAIVSAIYGDLRGLKTQSAGRSESVVTPQDDGDRSIAYQGDIHLGWNLFGYSYEETRGGACPDGYIRTGSDTRVYNGSGNCYVRDWLTQSPRDCAVIIHVGQSAGRTADCHWNVYRSGTQY